MLRFLERRIVHVMGIGYTRIDTAVVMHSKRSFARPGYKPPTKSELQAEMWRAAANTAALDRVEERDGTREHETPAT
jgi:hypothetical protein